MLCLFSALTHRVGALQIFIIIIYRLRFVFLERFIHSSLNFVRLLRGLHDHAQNTFSRLSVYHSKIMDAFPA